VQAIVAARLGHKSTLEETRTERFLNISQLDFPHYGKGMFPVALKVSGAHTHRLSGDWRLNQQNLARPSRKRPRAMLRESIVAR
jgi:DNA polymerase